MGATRPGPDYREITAAQYESGWRHARLLTGEVATGIVHGGINPNTGLYTVHMLRLPDGSSYSGEGIAEIMPEGFTFAS